MSYEKDASIAIEILAMKISDNMFNTKELNKLLKEKDLVLEGDKETTEKVINIYGKEIREGFKSARK